MLLHNDFLVLFHLILEVHFADNTYILLVKQGFEFKYFYSEVKDLNISFTTNWTFENCMITYILVHVFRQNWQRKLISVLCWMRGIIMCYLTSETFN